MPYVDSNAAGAGTGADWANAYPDTTAAENEAAGVTLYIASDHVETNASAVVWANATAAQPIKIISSDKTSGEPPTTYQRGAKVEMVGGDLNQAGEVDWKGVDFRTTSSFRFTGQHNFDDCSHHIDSTSSARNFNVSLGNQVLEFYNCVFRFGNAVQGFYLGGGGRVRLVGCSAHASSVSINGLYSLVTNRGGSMFIDSCDWTNFGSNFNLVSTPGLPSNDADGNASGIYGNRILMPVGAGVAESAITQRGFEIRVRGIGTGNDKYGLHDESNLGKIVHSTAVYRSGGAQYDPSATPTDFQYSVELSPTSHTSVALNPLWFDLLQRRLSADPTITVYLVYDRGSAFTDNEVWLEVERPRSGADVVTDIISSRNANPLATGTALATSTETWTHPAFSNEIKSQIVLPITGGAEGIHRARLCVATGAAEVLYGCPRLGIA